MNLPQNLESFTAHLNDGGTVAFVLTPLNNNQKNLCFAADKHYIYEAKHTINQTWIEKNKPIMAVPQGLPLDGLLKSIVKMLMIVTVLTPIGNAKLELIIITQDAAVYN